MVELWCGIFFLFGMIFGSFANVIIHRMPRDESIVKPRSQCPNCKSLIAWYDNIPILSWIILRAKCRKCRSPISWRYPLVELIMGFLFSAVFWKVGFTWFLPEYLIFVFGLVTASFIDIDHMILPDEFTLSGIVIGLIGAAINPGREFMSAFWGVILGGGVLWIVGLMYQVLRKKEGMGGGDVKLLAWIGAVLGWTSVPFVILSSSIVGSLFGVLLMLRRRSDFSTAIPFGPYLALGALLFLFFGHEFISWYLQKISLTVSSVR